MATGLPNAARLVTGNSAIPQGTIPPKCDRSGAMFTEKPWIVTHLRTRTPMAPILASCPFRSSVQLPMRQFGDVGARPGSIQRRMFEQPYALACLPRCHGGGARLHVLQGVGIRDGGVAASPFDVGSMIHSHFLDLPSRRDQGLRHHHRDLAER